ncbi:MAG: hypothetical protein AAF725_02895 [Acidobacteriota bacterium]
MEDEGQEAPGRPTGKAPSALNLSRERGLALLLALVALVFHRALLFGEVVYYRDIFYLNAGQLDFLGRSLRLGHGVPLWNPLHQGGMPFLADVNNQPLYPTSFLAALLSPFRVLTVAVTLHAALAGGALYALARRLGLPQVAAYGAGAIFALSGLALAHSNMPGRFFALMLLPPIVLAWHLALTRRRALPFAAAAALCATQILAGAPDLNALTFLTLLAWGAGLRTTSAQAPGREGTGRGLVAAWLLLGALTACLAAVQLLPLFEMTAGSSRSAGMPLEEFGHHSLDPRRLPELAVAGFSGRDTLDTEDFWGRQIVDSGVPYVVSITLGSLALCLAALGALSKSSPLPPRLRLLLTALAAAALLAALGRFLPGFAWLHAHLPGVTLFRFPSKVLALALLPAAVLAGGGLALLESAEGRRRAARLTGLAAALAGALALALAAGSPLERLLFGAGASAVEGGALVPIGVAAGLLAAATAALLALSPRRAGLAVAALLSYELWLASPDALKLTPAAAVEARPAALKSLEETLGAGRQTPGRLFRERQDWPSDFAAAPSRDALWRHLWRKETLGDYEATKYGVPMVFHADFHSLMPQRSVNLAFLVHQLPWERRLPLLASAGASAVMTPEKLALEGLREVERFEDPFAPGEPAVRLYRLSAAVERATLITRWRTVPGGEEAIEQMLYADFDPRRHAVVEGGPGDPKPAADCSAATGPKRVRFERVASGADPASRFRVETPCPALLSLSEVFDAGWRLTVNGQPAELRRVNYAWSGVFLPPGSHLVEVRYGPRSVTLGAALSLLGLLGSVLLVLRDRRH